MLNGALAGAGLGAAAGLLFWLATLTGLERLNQGLLGSAGFAGLIAACLVLDGWILTAIPGFVIVVIALARLHSRLR